MESDNLDEKELRFILTLVEEHLGGPASKRVPKEWIHMWKCARSKLIKMLWESTNGR